MSENFDIKLPMKDRYWCKIFKFVSVHETLSIRFSEVNSSKDLFIVDFVEVRYHSGPLYWLSESFEIALPEECSGILKQIVGFNSLTEDELFNAVNRQSTNYKLYKSGNTSLSTQIIATGAHLFTIDEYYP